MVCHFEPRERCILPPLYYTEKKKTENTQIEFQSIAFGVVQN